MKEFIRFFLGMIIGLFVGPIIVSSMIIIVFIYEFKIRLKEIKNDIQDS